MSITAKKIINSLLMVTLVVLLAGLAYYFTGKERLLMGSILDGADTSYVKAIEFVDPSGTAFPVNNVVTIEQIFVDFMECSEYETSTSCNDAPGCSWGTSCTGDMEYEDGNLTGDEIVSSFVFFGDEDDAMPAGAHITGNEIIVPSSFTDFDIDIYVPTALGPVAVNSTSLIISSVDCSGLQTSIMKGMGTSIFTGDPADLPTSAVSETVDFGEVIE